MKVPAERIYLIESEEQQQALKTTQAALQRVL